MKPSETKKNIINIIKQYSIETGIPLPFIEKDIYAVKILSILSEMNYPDVKIVFSGGTCLSKAYGKIKRFSEDLDFCIQTSIPLSRKDKSNFRKFIISKLNKNEDFNVLEPITITDESGFFSFEVEYSKNFETSTNLRKNIKIEFKFENLIQPINACEIKSFVHDFIDDEVVKINCIDILEVIANKYSALLWRSYIKDRSKPLYSKENDPTIMRHLYDIATLENELKNPKFVELLEKSYEKDNGRGGIENIYSVREFSKIVLDKIINDKFFKEEYENFVDTMCYSTDKISFDEAISRFKNIVEYIQEYKSM
jgi:predicted nucleotidyltransferase component of viral defense system